MGCTDNLLLEVLDLALHHDIDEVVEGDIPASTKEGMGFDYSGMIDAKWIVKIADTVEAYWFITDYGVGRTGEFARGFMQDEVHRMLEQIEPYYRHKVWAVIEQVMFGELYEQRGR